MNISLNKIQPKGFTIVELLVVIVVIGILATITTVAYNGVQKNAVGSQMKQIVQTAFKKMKLANADTEIYPTSFPTDLKIPETMGVALTEVATGKEFCINITSQKYTDLQWSMSQDGVLKEGLCTGNVITASIIGTYNTQAPAPSSIGIAKGDGGGFEIRTNEDWSSMTMSWDAIEGASRYEIQTRPSSADNWTLRLTADGSGAVNPSNANLSSYKSYTGKIASTTTSLSWVYSIPTAAGQVYEYRLRPYFNDVPSNTWYTANLTPPTPENLPVIDTFSVTPNGSWTSLVLSWNADSRKMPGPGFEIQTRTAPTETWRIRVIANGSGDVNPSNADLSSYRSYSGRIPADTNSLTWTSSISIPNTAGKTYDYRIRSKSLTLSGLYGEWKTVSVSR